MTSYDRDDDVSEHRLRFSDVAEEPRRMLPPIHGFEDKPLVSLEEAVKPIVKHIKDIERHALVAKQYCKTPPADGLSADESASIRLYTMEWKPRNQCLYFVLNQTLRSENRSLLKDWFLYLRLIINALSKIPSISRIIFRGVKLNLLQDYPTGQNIVWWAFSSCTNSMQVLEKGPFFGQTGIRTLFQIDCYSGKSISHHSAFPNENEVLLLAAMQFQIVSSLDVGHGLHIIHLKEVEPEVPLIKKIPAAEAHFPASVDQVNIRTLTNYPTYHNLDLERYIDRFQFRSNINLDGQQLNDADMSIVVKRAILSKQCVKLSLQNNRIASEGILTLAKGISESTTLEELDLSNNYLADEDLFLLTRELSIQQVAIVQQWKCCGVAKVKVNEYYMILENNQS